MGVQCIFAQQELFYVHAQAAHLVHLAFAPAALAIVWQDATFLLRNKRF